MRILFFALIISLSQPVFSQDEPITITPLEAWTPSIPESNNLQEDYNQVRPPEPEADGVASWYGPKFHGRLTANGETYDMHGLTAAHKTLPFNTKLRVTNLNNGKSVVLRINDRGPFLHNRIIDLSKGAAVAVDMIETGTAPVMLEVLEMPNTCNLYMLQIASFADPENAQNMLDKLTASGVGAEIQKAGVYNRVVIPNLLKGQLSAMSAKIERMGLGKPLQRKQN